MSVGSRTGDWRYQLGTVVLLGLSSLSRAEPPKTVNGIELGAAEEFTNIGPAKICMRELVIRPLQGQSVQLLYSGIHVGTLRLTLADGSYIDFSDGEIFQDQRRRGQTPELVRDDMKVFRIRRQNSDSVYQLEGAGRRNDDDTPPRVMVSGTALKKSRADWRLFDLMSIEDSATADCDRRYSYGWGVILEGEPVMINNPGNDEKLEN